MPIIQAILFRVEAFDYVRQHCCFSMPALEAAALTHLLESAESGLVWQEQYGCVHHHLWDTEMNMGLEGLPPPRLRAPSLSSPLRCCCVSSPFHVITACVFEGWEEISPPLCLCPNNNLLAKWSQGRTEITASHTFLLFLLCLPPSSVSVMWFTHCSLLSYCTIICGITFYMAFSN